MPGKGAGQVAIVTGAGRGLGRAYAHALAAEGASVVVNDNGTEMDGRGSSKVPADTVAREIAAQGGRAIANHEDITDYNGAKRVVDVALSSFGRLDTMVTNAATDRRGPALDLTQEDWESTIRHHVYGSLWSALHAGRAMRQQGQGGAIINITSPAYFGGPMWLAPYSTSKGATFSMMRSLSNDLKKYNITVNAIAPSSTTTRATKHYNSLHKEFRGATDAEVEAMDKNMQQPENVAPLVVYLASQEGRRYTGCAFTVMHDMIALLTGGTANPTYTTANMWDVDTVAKALPRIVPTTALMPQGT